MSQNIPIPVMVVSAVVFAVVVAYIVLRMRSGFWFYQPVVHSYDILRLLQSPRVISAEPVGGAAARLYRNHARIRTVGVAGLDARQREHFMALIRLHYLRNRGGNVYEPAGENVWPYFEGHDEPCWLSLYYEPATYIGEGQALIVDEVPVGAMTSRPLTIDGLTTDVKEVYYVEYLCVHRDYRRRGIAPQIIQTHEFNQRTAVPRIRVSLFKHEDTLLQGIVPLVVYTTYGFPIGYWMAHPPRRPQPPYRLTAVREGGGGGEWGNTLQNLVDFMRGQRKHYRVFICSALANLAELIRTGNLHVHVLVDMDAIVPVAAAYFYRNSCVRLEEGQGAVLSLVATLCAETTPNNVFMMGFRSSFFAIAKRHGYGYCAVENVAQNGRIVRELQKKTAATIRSPCAYFFYNYVYPTVASDQIFILH